MSFKTVVLDRVRLVDLDTLFIYHLVCALVCICSFIDSDTTARDIMGVEFGIDIFITVFSIWKSLWVLQKALIKIVAHAIYTYQFFSFTYTLLFCSKIKKLLQSLFSLAN